MQYLASTLPQASESIFCFWMQELQAQSEKMATEKIAQDREQRNLLTVIGTLQTDIQSLEGMHGQDRSEMQRLQQVVRELQQENAALKSRRQQVED